MVREGPVKASRSTALESLRIQLVPTLFFAVLVPAWLRHPSLAPFGAFQVAEIENSAIGAAIAAVAGLIFLRKVTAFPGTSVFGYILPTLGACYAVVLVIILGGRLDYSSLYLGYSLAAALAVTYAISYWLERRGSRRFYLVPFGRIDEIAQIPDVEWIRMNEARVPDDPAATIVADLHHDHDPAWERMLAEAAVRGHPVYHTKQLGESLTGQVSIAHLSENSFGSLLPNLAYRKVKRAFDLAFSLLLLPVVLPVMLVIAALIRLDSKGPVLFRQERMGYRGLPFIMYKFRTMRPRATAADEEAAREDAMTKAEDGRITRVGRFLRKWRIDELPQIINVFTGEMSWIGPRPEAVALSRWYEAEIPFYLYRHIVRPGLTGWAQVNQGHVTSVEDVWEKLNYDFYYVKNFSAWLDALILFRTVPTMLSGYGSK